MTKPGPKRKEGERYPSGALRREARHQETSPSAIKRMVERAKRGAEDPLLGTAMGQLHLEDKITHRQLAAVESYVRLRTKFDRMIGIPRRHLRSSAGQNVVSDPDDRPPPPLWVELELDERIIRHVKAEHSAMLIAVGPSYPMLERYCLDDERPPWSMIAPLRVALDGLADHFGMER